MFNNFFEYIENQIINKQNQKGIEIMEKMTARKVKLEYAGEIWDEIRAFRGTLEDLEEYAWDFARRFWTEHFKDELYPVCRAVRMSLHSRDEIFLARMSLYRQLEDGEWPTLIVKLYDENGECLYVNYFDAWTTLGYEYVMDAIKRWMK